ncbi:MAG: dgoA protein, partial [Planctomycetota bacterium]|nr:dgoA protein [Planctomycetota bacterium]
MNAMNSRRQFLGRSLPAIAGLGLLPGCTPLPRRAAVGTSARHLIVDKVETETVKLPYRAAPNRAMSRELPHWRYVEIFRVHLRSGKVGIGETLLYYTWGVSTEAHIKRVVGKNAADFMWDDGLGAGLQIALFDAVAKTLEVPVHRLLGRKVHEKTPLSWWNIDMNVEDMASECREALRLGYLSYKTKGRPWFDIWKQVEVAAKAVPETFKID